VRNPVAAVITRWTLAVLFAGSVAGTAQPPGAGPVISGVFPVFSPTPIIQPGSWVSIYGTGLACGVYFWSGNFPTILGGTSVSNNGKAAYLSLVSPDQINLQAPDDTTTGLVSVIVDMNCGQPTFLYGEARSTVTLAAYGPSFSLFGDGDARHVAAEIPTPNGTGAYGGGSYDLAGPLGMSANPVQIAGSLITRPVKIGEILILYGVGFGPTTPSIPARQLFSGAAPTNSPVMITIGGALADVLFAGLTEAGLYQFNVVVPNVAGGNQPVIAMVNGVRTPLGPLVAVQ